MKNIIIQSLNDRIDILQNKIKDINTLINDVDSITIDDEVNINNIINLANSDDESSVELARILLESQYPKIWLDLVSNIKGLQTRALLSDCNITFNPFDGTWQEVPYINLED